MYILNIKKYIYMYKRTNIKMKRKSNVPKKR